ncbi:MAG: DUF4317 domain-containing protein [Oscillospiraceae bacterium]|nr:DUF4317 domain-containing protein [Oscillospiraceae bacterium]
MKEKEIGELRRHIRRDRSNMTAIHGCFVSEGKEVVSKFRLSTGMMPENESEKYFAMMKKVLSGALGKNLIDISFRTAQVVDSPEHKLLTALKDSQLKDEEALEAFYQKVMDSVTMDTGYLILIGADAYDVPYKGKDGNLSADGSNETYRCILCAVCPVKLSKPVLEYKAEIKEFHDSAVTQLLSAPVLGFLFPAFDNRSTNLYNALLYSKDAGDNHEQFVSAIFNTQPYQTAKEQKQSFEALLGNALDDECSLDVVQAVHAEIGSMIQMHKESRVDEPLMLDKEDVKAVLQQNGISEEKLAKFSVDYDEAFGFETQLHPKNVIDQKRFEIKTPDVTIKVNPERSDLIETRVIGGVKYILICADENVEVNGVSINIKE